MGEPTQSRLRIRTLVLFRKRECHHLLMLITQISLLRIAAITIEMNQKVDSTIRVDWCNAGMTVKPTQASAVTRKCFSCLRIAMSSRCVLIQ